MYNTLKDGPKESFKDSFSYLCCVCVAVSSGPLYLKLTLWLILLDSSFHLPYIWKWEYSYKGPRNRMKQTCKLHSLKWNKFETDYLLWIVILKHVIEIVFTCIILFLKLSLWIPGALVTEWNDLRNIII